MQEPHRQRKALRSPANEEFEEGKPTVIDKMIGRLKFLVERADSCTVETGEVAMKIEVNSPTVNQLPSDRGPKQVSNGSVGGVQDATEDRTTLQSDSLSVQSLTSQALNTPAIRQDKVDALRQSVNSGEYQVDAKGIADAMIGSGEM